MLRVRADTIDRLVNEAGEVAIARARIDGELRALKANLLELTGSVIRLRSQVREIEIQAESQIQSRMTQMHEHSDDFDPLEFDRYTRFQELTRSLAEGVNDVSTVQQALLKNLDDADAALSRRRACRATMQQQLFAIRTVPFSSLSERLYRIVRQVAKELGKRVALEIVVRRPSSTARCWKSSPARSSTCCATRSTTASKAGMRAVQSASPRPARSRCRCVSPATRS